MRCLILALALLLAFARPGHASCTTSTPFHGISGGSTASNNLSQVGNFGSHQLCDLVLISTSATLAYVKLYDLSALPADCTSATGLKHVFPVPASANGAGFVRAEAGGGEQYLRGIVFCVVGGGGDTDNSNAPTGVFIEGSFH